MSEERSEVEEREQLEPSVDADVDDDASSTPVHLPRGRRVSPWSTRIVLVSVVVALLLLPIWLDPFTLREVRNVTPGPGTPVPTRVARPATPVASGVPIPVGIVFVQDSFTRNAQHDWGEAELGGGYGMHIADFGAPSVDGTSALLKLGSEGSGWASTGTGHRDVDVLATVAMSTAAGTVSAGPAVRVTDEGLYRARVVSSDTGVWLVIEHVSTVAAEDDIVLAGPVALPGVTYDGASQVMVRAEAEGSDPTTISAKAWMAGEEEPGDWQITAVDWTGALQHEGSVGVAWQVQNVPEGGVDISFDDLTGTTTDGEGHR